MYLLLYGSFGRKRVIDMIAERNQIALCEAKKYRAEEFL